MQIDVGLGDAITPRTVEIEYPALLDQPRARLGAYPVETAIAEKLEAIVDLGLANSRMKDFFDLWTLLDLALEGTVLVAAVRATFERRGTPLPESPPIGMTQDFVADADKRRQWTAFLHKLQRTQPPLRYVVDLIAAFAMPIFDGSAAGRHWGSRRGWLA